MITNRVETCTWATVYNSSNNNNNNCIQGCVDELFILKESQRDAQVQYFTAYTVSLLAFGEPSFRISSRALAILTEVFRDLPQSLPSSSEIVSRLGHDSFPPGSS
jgi:hypothetical protein